MPRAASSIGGSFARAGAALILALASVLTLAGAARADSAMCARDDGRTWRDGAAFSLISENDIYSGADRNYTNGIQLGVVSGPCNALLGTGFLSEHLLPERFDADDRAWRAGVAAGQMMFTPADISAVVPDPDDRPYAAWLYASFTLISQTTTPGDVADLETAKLDLGWIGPGAGGEWVQTNWHHMINGAEPMGWGGQLRDEPTVNFTYDATRRWRLPAPGWLDADADLRAGGSLGNVAIHASAGGSLRLGQGFEGDYGPPRIRPALGGATFFSRSGRPFGWYLFAGVEGRAVGRDIFLDGNTFRDSPSVDKEPFVFDAQTGAAVRLGRARVTFTYVHRSESFVDQVGPDRFGAITLSVRN